MRSRILATRRGLGTVAEPLELGITQPSFGGLRQSLVVPVAVSDKAQYGLASTQTSNRTSTAGPPTSRMCRRAMSFSPLRRHVARRCTERLRQLKRSTSLHGVTCAPLVPRSLQLRRSADTQPSSLASRSPTPEHGGRRLQGAKSVARANCTGTVGVSSVEAVNVFVNRRDPA